MDKGVYEWWAGHSIAIGKIRILSAIKENSVFSMAQLGELRSLKFGEENFYYRDRVHGDVDKVFIPHELSKLLHVPVVKNASVWLNDDFPSGVGGKEFGLRIQLMGDFYRVSCIWLWYGFKSGVLALEFDGMQRFVCGVPSGFNLDSFINLLNAGEDAWEKFVIDNGKLNNMQKQRLRKVGLDGLKKSL